MRGVAGAAVPRRPPLRLVFGQTAAVRREQIDLEEQALP
jgi:hypothetical protein